MSTIAAILTFIIVSSNNGSRSVTTPTSSNSSPQATTEVILPSTSTPPSSIITPLPTNTVEPSPVSTSNVIFTENFNDNHQGWPLGGSTRLSQEKLAVTVDRTNISSNWLILPNVIVGQNFYIEAQMSFQEGHGCFSAMGFAVGNNGGNHHRFLLIGGTDLDCEQGIAFFNNENQLFATPYNSVMEKEKTYVVSLESLNGVYT